MMCKVISLFLGFLKLLVRIQFNKVNNPVLRRYFCGVKVSGSAWERKHNAASGRLWNRAEEPVSIGKDQSEIAWGGEKFLCLHRQSARQTMQIPYQSLSPVLVAGVEIKDALYRWESMGGSFLNARGRTASVDLSFFPPTSHYAFAAYKEKRR
eukprot:1156778-Pelagomonas_calceolata.AAC.1